MGPASKSLTASGNLALDQHPMKLDGFTFRARSVRAVGTPTKDQWQRALAFAEAAKEGAEWWIADLLHYARERGDWQEAFDQLLTVTQLAPQTLRNIESLGKAVDEPERRIAPSVKHADMVRTLSQRDQRKMLIKAADEGWTSSELRAEVRATQRTKVLEGQAELEGMFRVIYADPPWQYQQAAPAASGAFTTAEHHYPTLPIADLCKLPVMAHSEPNSVLFMWVTSPMLYGNPGPREVMEAWGFTYKASCVWDKVLGNYGHYVRVHHELLLIGTRGSCLPDNPTPMPDSVQVFRRQEHSAKPEEFRAMIDRLYPKGRRVELFAREQPPKPWIGFGNDARLWAKEAGK